MKDQLIGAFSLACISMVLCSCRAAPVVIEVQGSEGVQKDPYRILFPDRPSDKLVVQLPGLVFGQRYFVHAFSSGEDVVDIGGQKETRKLRLYVGGNVELVLEKRCSPCSLEVTRTNITENLVELDIYLRIACDTEIQGRATD